MDHFKNLYWIHYNITSVLCFGWEACEILAPWPGVEPKTPALEGAVLTTGPPGKSPTAHVNLTSFYFTTTLYILDLPEGPRLFCSLACDLISKYVFQYEISYSFGDHYVYNYSDLLFSVCFKKNPIECLT